MILLDCGLSMGRLVGKNEREIVKPATAGSPQEITIDDDVEIRHLALQGTPTYATSLLLSSFSDNVKRDSRRGSEEHRLKIMSQMIFQRKKVCLKY